MLNQVRMVAVSLFLVTVMGSYGCRSTQTQAPAAATRIDRLIQTYDELRSGRFAILADFEDPNHLQLAKVIGVSPSAACMINSKKGSGPQASNALAFSFGSPDDTLAFSNEQATDWYLKRDWRGFDLLMLSVESVQPGLTAELTIAAGQPSARQQVHTKFALNRGSNVLRFDLAELGEQIPLDDVRAILFSVSGASGPTEVYVDDLLLAANSQDIFGDSTKSDGRLYVRTFGTRTRVGAGGQFELTFANGQVVEWFDLATDPSRLQNRVAGTTLGPTPVFADYHSYKVGKAHLTGVWGGGGKGRISHAIVERNEIRVVVRFEWRFPESGSLTQTGESFNSWIYTVYPTGQVFVSLVAPAFGLYKSDFTLGMAVGLTPPDDFTLKAGPVLAEGDASEDRQDLWAAMHDPDGKFAFLWIPGTQDGAHRFLFLDDESGETTTLFTSFQRFEDKIWNWTSQFILTPADVTPEQASARAIEFVTPMAPTLEVGHFNQPDNQPEAWGPFDRGLGQYSVTPDRGRVRMTLDQKVRRVFSPAFVIEESANKEVWVYLNNVIVKDLARDARGNVLFQLPADLPRRSVIEALVKDQ